MPDRHPNIVSSDLSRTVAVDGVTVVVNIYRLEGDPQWALLGVAHAWQLPGVRWKLHNLDQLKRTNPMKFSEQHARLVERFDSVDQRRG